nr:DUF998 domain-containing protein [Campylobacterota bacterium]
LSFKYDGYNHLIDTISALGSNDSPVAWQESLNLIVIGILYIIFSFGQNNRFKITSKYTRRYFLGIFIFGVGTIIAGIFPEDSKGLTQESISDKMHGIFSAIGLIFLIFNPLWATFIDEFRKYKLLNSVLFVFGLLTFILFLASENIETGFLQYTGLFQRVNLLVLYSVLIINFMATDEKTHNKY